MYLDREIHHLFQPSSSPRIPTKIRMVISNLNHQIDQTKDRLPYSGTTFTTGYSILLNSITRGMDDDFYKQRTDLDRLYNVLEFQRTYITRDFDSSGGGGLPHKKCFINSPGCREFIFSVKPRDMIKSYPLDKGPDAWKSYRPFRLVDHDSSDFTLNITTGLLNFKRNLPRFALFTYDPVAAILQYNALKDKISIEHYIYSYLIIPALTLDNIRLWMLGNYSQWFLSRSRSYNDIPMVTSNYARLPITMDNAMGEIGRIIDDSTRGHITPNRLLTSLPLPYHTDICSYAMSLYHRSGIDDIGEYDWATFMIYRRMLDVLSRALGATINSTETRTHIQLLKRAIQLMVNSGIYSGIKDSYTKTFVKGAIQSLERQVLDMYTITKQT